jgi:hypothetical protein
MHLKKFWHFASLFLYPVQGLSGPIQDQVLSNTALLAKIATYLDLKETLNLAISCKAIYKTISKANRKTQNFFHIENLHWRKHLLKKKNAVEFIRILSVHADQKPETEQLPLCCGLTYIRPIVLQLQSVVLEKLEIDFPNWQNLLKKTNIYLLAPSKFFQYPDLNPRICGTGFYLPSEIDAVASFPLKKNLRVYTSLMLDDWNDLTNPQEKKRCLECLKSVPEIYFLDWEAKKTSWSNLPSDFFSQALEIMEKQTRLRFFSYSGLSFPQQQFDELIKTISFSMPGLTSFFAQNQSINEVTDTIVESIKRLSNLHTLTLFQCPVASAKKLLSSLKKEQIKNLCINFSQEPELTEPFISKALWIFLKSSFQIKRLYLGRPVSDKNPDFSDVLKAYSSHKLIENFICELNYPNSIYAAFSTIGMLSSLNDITLHISCRLSEFDEELQELFRKMFENKTWFSLSLGCEEFNVLLKAVKVLPVRRIKALSFFCAKLHNAPNLKTTFTQALAQTIGPSQNMDQRHATWFNGEPLNY